MLNINKMTSNKSRALFYFLIFILISCQRHYINNGDADKIIYPAVRFAVLSDPHYFSPKLGTSGKAFENYLKHDRKLIRESSEIFETAIDRIAEESPDFILIPGDLTKDGELLNHEEVADLLYRLEQKNIKIYVVPGNHDINNFEAYQYRSDSAASISSVTPEIFQKIYHDFGYDEAVGRDSASLSYVAEPTPGLWIFGLDACRYEENTEGHHSNAGGRFKKITLSWIKNMLIRAGQENKAVIGFMHHGMLEHFEYQSEYFQDYILKDWRSISRLFASHNMKLVFTGHFHAQDIVRKRFSNDKFIYDIETGSLVTYPCPWRMITIPVDQKMTIKSHFIDSVYSFPDNFTEYAYTFLQSGINSIFLQKTKSVPMLAAEARYMARDFTGLLMAHYQGDESTDDHHMHIRGCMSCCLLSLTSEMIEGLEIDPDPPDNNATIDLQIGEFY